MEPENVPQECPGVNSEQAGKSNACYGCPNQSQCANGDSLAPDVDQIAIRERLACVKNTILIMANKGGCGKSTIAAHLAYGFAEAHSEGRTSQLEVGVLDVDLTGPSAPHLFSVASEEVHQAQSGWQPVYARDNLAVMSIGFMLPSREDAVAWRGARKTGLLKQFLRDVDWGLELDYLIVDCPPGTSDEHITVAHYLQGIESVSAVIATTPQEMALLDVRKQVNFCRKAGIRILGVVENMAGFVCSHCGHCEEVYAPTTGGASKMCQDMNIPLLGSIPLDPALMRACELGEPLRDTNSSSWRALQKVRERIQSAINHSERSEANSTACL